MGGCPSDDKAYIVSTEPPVRFGFILGIHRRCGTNFLYRLLLGHPDCDGIGPIGEDYLVQHTDLLMQYVESVKSSWNPEWRMHTVHEGRDTFYQYIGDSILRLLQDQSDRHCLATGGNGSSGRRDHRSRVVVTKTPAVGGASNFFTFFPDACLILLVRDGRAVVESGVRSFGWHFEKASREWACAARQILAILATTSVSRQVKLVRYEDLVQDDQTVLKGIFDFLGLDPQRYDFGETTNLGVIGSSDLARKGGAVHWDAMPQADGFTPLKRFERWTPAMHERFNWIAGREMEMLGYDVKPTHPPGCMGRLLHRLRDVCWYVQALAPEIRGFVLRIPAKARRLFQIT